ncbi:MAG TPA: DUF2165 domain-containing protein [Ignavibacteria bacterium]|nr:DUF2165 domain-containing protein [Ignavibacteria bacterium]
MVIRISKIVLLLIIALNLAIVALNNILDYNSNYEFVKNILNMSTTFPDNNLMWRKIESPFMWNLFYIVIIVCEILIAALCFAGSASLFKSLKKSDIEFNKAKKFGIIGLVFSLILYGFAFITIGGEWFLMWQSTKWNGELPALKMFILSGIILLFMNQKDS